MQYWANSKDTKMLIFVFLAPGGAHSKILETHAITNYFQGGLYVWKLEY